MILKQSIFIKIIIMVMIMGFGTITFSQQSDIFQAIENNDLPGVKVAIQKDIKNLEFVLDHGDKNTPLLMAGEKGNLEIVKYLIEKGAKINAQNADGNTALHLAARRDHFPIVKYLIKNGIDVNAKNRGGSIAVQGAIWWKSDYTLIEYLFNKGEIVDGETYLNLLQAAASKKYKRVIDYLLDRNVEIPNSDQAIGGLLYRSIIADHVRLLERLLGIKPDMLKGKEEYWVNFVGEKGATNILEKFISLNYNLDVKNYYGNSLIHQAAKNYNLGMVKLLVTNGQDIDAKNSIDQTALHISKEKGFHEISSYLIQQGASEKPYIFPKLKGPYLGQETPREEPMIFAKGIVSIEGSEHSPPVFSNDGKEVFWSAEYPMKIYKMVYEKNRWSAPKKAQFNYGNVISGIEPVFSSAEPTFSSDNKKLFFISERSMDGLSKIDEKYGMEYIWYVEKEINGWSKAKYLNGNVNKNPMHWTISLNNENTIYFSSKQETVYGSYDIYKSTLKNGEYQTPINIGNTINTELLETCPFIARDNSYLIYSIRNHPNGIGSFDLFISYRTSNGDWTKGINLGKKINSRANDLTPQVTPDGKYLFYTSSGDIYWVDTSFIEKLRPEN